MSAAWIGPIVTLPAHIEAHMRETAAVWQTCPGCRRQFFGQRAATCLGCDPTKEQIQPGVYRTKR